MAAVDTIAQQEQTKQCVRGHHFLLHSRKLATNDVKVLRLGPINHVKDVISCYVY